MSGFAGGPFARWMCLICHRSFPIAPCPITGLPRAYVLCEPCIQATDPGPNWEPKTDWGRDRKAERAAAAETVR